MDADLNEPKQGEFGFPDDAEILREREEQLRIAEKMESVGLLAGGLAHDLNNILSGILGYTSYLMSKVPRDGELHRDLGRIEQSAIRVADLARQLTLFARRRHAARDSVLVNAAVTEAVAEIKMAVEDRIAIETNLADNLPPVGGDPVQIRLMVRNLCQHVADAMPEHGVVTVSTEVRPLSDRERNVLPGSHEGEYVCIRVTDPGPALNRDAVRRLFDPYSGGKGAKKSGLLLPIVYGIAHNHHGLLSVESGDNERGNTFRVFLPSQQNRAASGIDTVDRQLDGAETILIVDDEAIVRDMAAAVLKSHGYQAVCVATAEEAMKLLRDRKTPVNLVLLDLILPGLSGEDALKALRETDPNVRVLLTSGLAQDVPSDRLAALGAQGIVSKPYRGNALSVAIRKALDQKLS